MLPCQVYAPSSNPATRTHTHQHMHLEILLSLHGKSRSVSLAGVCARRGFPPIVALAAVPFQCGGRAWGAGTGEVGVWRRSFGPGFWGPPRWAQVVWCGVCVEGAAFRASAAWLPFVSFFSSFSCVCVCTWGGGLVGFVQRGQRDFAHGLHMGIKMGLASRCVLRT